MRLRHQALEVVDVSLAAVLRVLEMAADVDRFLGTDLLAIAAENAAELVDLEQERIAIALLVLARNQLDAIRRTDRRAESAGDALRLAVLGREHAMRSPPARRERLLLLRVFDRHLVRVDEVLERARHALDRGADVTGLLDRPLEHLHSNRHLVPHLSLNRAPYV